MSKSSSVGSFFLPALLFQYLVGCQHDESADQVVQKSESYFVKLLNDKNKEKRIEAVLGLRDLGEKGRWGLTYALDDDVEEIRLESANALVGALGDPEERIRSRAARLIWLTESEKLKKTSIVLLPALVKCLHDRNDEVRFHAICAIGQYGSDAETVLPDLMKSIKEDNDQVREAAVETVGKIGSKAKAAVPILIEAINDKYLPLREMAIWSIGQIGPDDEASISKLIEALNDSSVDVRLKAAISLGLIGKKASSALEHLKKLLFDNERKVRLAAKKAIEEIE